MSRSSIEGFLRRVAVLACAGFSMCVPFAAAQSTYEVASFQRVTSSQADAERLFTPAGGTIAFGVRDFVEVELPVDEHGRHLAVSHLFVQTGSNSAVEIEVFGSAVAGGPLTSFGLRQVDAQPNPIGLASPTRLAAVRLEFRRNLGANPSGQLSQVRVHALLSSRAIAITGHGWYVSQPSSGSWTSFALEISPSVQDNFGLLFVSVGSPLLATPILQIPTGNGGLLLDPASISLIDARPLNGVTSWPFVASFPFDPAIVSAPIHLQAVLGDALTRPSQPLLHWTRPVTIYS
jgi:hypothetical protein